MLALLQTQPEVEISFSTVEAVVTIVICALAAYIVHEAMAIANDGVRPFMLDFIRGKTSRGEITAISFGLSAGFIFGLGTPLFFSTGILNVWLLLLPADILGLLAPRRWLAPILGGAWGATVIYGLGSVASAAAALPIDFLTALQNLATPILFLFSLFPAIAVANQFGRVRGAIAFLVTILSVVLTARFLPNLFAGTFALVVGILFLVGFALQKDLAARRAMSAEERAAMSEIAAGSLFAENAERIRKNVLWFVGFGALLALLSNLKVYAAGEATSFLIQQGNYLEAAQIDFYRGLGFVPLIVTTALASGAYGLLGLSFLFPFGYIAPNPVIALVGGGVIAFVEVYAISYLGRALSLLPSIRDASDSIRNAINSTLELAILFGSILAGNAMAGGLGIAFVGGLYALNEASGRPIVRLAAGPTAVIITGVLLNVLFGLELFTPPPAPEG
jgi:hypothetical protein